MNDPVPPADDAARAPRAPVATPRRGAIPTPREVIEQATPYVPGAPPAGDAPATPATNTNDDDKRG
jgi:hypothetical protein